MTYRVHVTRENGQWLADVPEATERLAILLTRRGYSARDAGPLLGISHQRISQIRPAVAASTTVDKSNRTRSDKAGNHKAVGR